MSLAMRSRYGLHRSVSVVRDRPTWTPRGVPSEDMTTPHDRITTSPEYAHWYQHYTAQGDTPEDAARNAYAVTAEAVTKRKRATNRTLAIVAAAIVLVGAGLTTVLMFMPDTDTGVRRTVTAPQPPPEEPPPPPSPAKYTPVPTDFELTVKITEKQCFGSAGCSLSFRVDAAYGGLPLDEGDSWLITYTITGGEDGPQINSFRLQGSTVTQDSEEFMSTNSTKVVPKAAVTSVARN